MLIESKLACPASPFDNGNPNCGVKEVCEVGHASSEKVICLRTVLSNPCGSVSVSSPSYRPKETLKSSPVEQFSFGVGEG
jgi:hypothetical protein